MCVYGEDAAFYTVCRIARKTRGIAMLKEALTLVPKWVYFLLLLVFFELLADILAKQFALSGKYTFAVLSIVVLSTIGAVIVAIFLYHEKVTPYQGIGLLLGIAAIILLSIE